MTSALALALVLAGPAPATGIQWEKSFDHAMELAAEQDKPVMVDFWADWCGWCHRLDRTTYVDPVVGAKAKNFVAVKVNTEGSRREASGRRAATRSTRCPRSSFSLPAGGRC